MKRLCGPATRKHSHHKRPFLRQGGSSGTHERLPASTCRRADHSTARHSTLQAVIRGGPVQCVAPPSKTVRIHRLQHCSGRAAWRTLLRPQQHTWCGSGLTRCCSLLLMLPCQQQQQRCTLHLQHAARAGCCRQEGAGRVCRWRLCPACRLRRPRSRACAAGW